VRSTLSRFVCIHGHFYQPPRENPWLEAVELQDAAYPYHDWNERITDECYAQNAASRVLDRDGRIAHIVNNYGRISFNVGPTLLAWMQEHAADVHDAIVAADRESAARFGGHGSALAQAYGHMIMPLASERDRRTQVRWGIADFRHRFGRDPEGMWLPETAVCVDTLEALAEHGIGFTILEPHQAARVRPLGDSRWVDVSDGSVDTTMPYAVRLPSGHRITVFFYNGAVSRAIAFEGLLASGALLAERLRRSPVPDRAAVLVHVATDGESYGHHHRHGDMALAFALHELEPRADVTLTNYAQFLELHPPTHEVDIAERTSWSCAHGVERWRSDCGCADGEGHPDWNQAWRGPLREALDWLRDEVGPRFEDRARGLLRDPWEARDDYIDVLIDTSDDRRAGFLRAHAGTHRGKEEAIAVWKLLELQRHAMLMYTSCGWYFDDLARIETIQVLRYAGRVVELAADLFGVDLEGGFTKRLAEARSNDPAAGDGRQVYDTHVRPARVALEDVAGHYAVSSLFAPYQSQARVYCYEVESTRRFEDEAGAARLALDRIRVRSLVTGEDRDLDIGVLHLGDHNIDAGIREATREERYDETRAALASAFQVADLPETLRRLEEEFPEQRFTLNSLFRDEQRRVLRTILDASIEDARTTFRRVYRARAALMRYLTEIDARIPVVFLRAAEVTLNDDLRRAFADDELDSERVATLLADAEAWGIELDTEGLALALSTTIERLTNQAARALQEPTLFDHFGHEERAFFARGQAVIEMTRTLPFEVDLWRAQNLYFATLQRVIGDLDGRTQSGDATAADWAREVRALGVALGFAVDAAPDG
jgi:alpha-amylase/alpha-mannosidase (GH57 family)